MMSDTPAGWYSDPSNPSIQRYWDGQAWTENTAPVAQAAPSAAYPAPGAYSPAPPANPQGGRYMVPSVLMLVCCNLIAGVFALVFSMQSRTAASNGDALEAAKYDKWAKTALIAGVIVSVVVIGILIASGGFSFHAGTNTNGKY